ncbi:MAG: Gmad2 immunoglobulin-like domain-containing protein [bacterium]|nr:Gmad2 immunoglobulin-like domain-containing protein [bacterium]
MNEYRKLVIWPVVAVVLIGIVLGTYTYVRTTGDTLNGTTIEIPADIAAHIVSKSDLVVLESPAPFSMITSPLTVRGQARGVWYFEATFPITLVDWDGRIIAESYASAILDPSNPESTWMTSEFVPFEGTLIFDVPPDAGDFSRRGALILQKNNPSGLPEHDDALEIPIMFEDAE